MGTNLLDIPAEYMRVRDGRTASAHEMELPICFSDEDIKNFFHKYAWESRLPEKEVEIRSENWVDFALSLFPNARNFTRDEQEAFDAVKKRRFARRKLDF